MRTKIFYEENQTIKIILNDYIDGTIIEICKYFDGYEQLTVDFDFIDYDFEFIVEKYKNNLIKY